MSDTLQVYVPPGIDVGRLENEIFWRIPQDNFPYPPAKRNLIPFNWGTKSEQSYEKWPTKKCLCDKQFGLQAYYLNVFTGRAMDKAESTGEKIRKEAFDEAWNNHKIPRGVFCLSVIGAAAAFQLTRPKTHGYWSYFPAPRWMGGPTGLATIVMGLYWLLAPGPMTVEANMRQKEKYTKKYEAHKEDLEEKKKAWEEHKSSSEGWWAKSAKEKTDA
eukprot:NODE_3920_length_862_cov_25.177122_g3253_i0.p1 GENE.NODE_3920_length_862_cov_25.177122_g3253_i0~~NODE_3920_length_862_cov_25.177122_g3253_i0.p1  ORF type:complete len:216 (-),score=70.87 NODE_3920_length_862_cov_25.177122_g3253_i0:100-747(-)